MLWILRVVIKQSVITSGYGIVKNEKHWYFALPWPEGYYSFLNDKSGKMLDISGKKSQRLRFIAAIQQPVKRN